MEELEHLSKELLLDILHALASEMTDKKSCLDFTPPTFNFSDNLK